MQRVIRHSITILALLLAVLLVVFTSCENTRPDITISFESDARSVRDALKGMSQSLADRLAQLESAMEGGMADYQEALSQVRQAVDSLGGSLDEKLAAVTEVVKLQGTSLEAKLALIEAAVSAGFADGQAQQALLQEAVAALEGSEEEKLAALETAVKNQGAGFETRMGLIEASVREGLAGQAAAQALLKETLETLGGSMEEKLAAIDTALVSQQASLASKLALIETAVQEGFAGERTQDTMIAQALDSLMGGEDEKLAALAETMESQLSGLEAKLALMEASVSRQFADEQATINLLQKALTSLKGTAEGIDARIDAVVSMLGTVDPTTGSIADLLAAIRTDVSGIPDIEAQIAAIENLVKQMDINPIEFTDFVTDNVLVIGDTVLMVPYLLPSSDYTVEATASAASGDVTVAVVPDSVDPLKGFLKIGAIEITTAQVELRISNSFGSKTQTLKIVKEQLDPDPKNQDKNLNYDDSFDETHPLIFTYRTNTPGIVTIPDSSKHWVRLLYASSNAGGTTLDTIKIAIDPNKGYNLRLTGVTVTNRVSTDILTFLIDQNYDHACIDFKDPTLEAYLLTKIDYNHSKSIEKVEAAAVTSLVEVFGDALTDGASYTSFNEFQYFTGITELPAGSFAKWTNLESIKLPESITTLEIDTQKDAILQECPKLRSIRGPFATADSSALVYPQGNETILVAAVENRENYTIPSGVTTIGHNAFYKNTTLQTVVIDQACRTIQDSVFNSCSNLLYAHFLGSLPPVGGENMFGGTNTCSIYVPSDKVSTYQQKWDGLVAADRIKGWESHLISFSDANLKACLVDPAKGIDTDGDGEISYTEAANVTDLKKMFGDDLMPGAQFKSFDEFQYFKVGVLPAGSFKNWTQLQTITLPDELWKIDIDFKDQAGSTPSTDQTVFFNCPKLEFIKGKFANEEKSLIYHREGETTSKLVKVCETIQAFYVPQGVDTIARYCFYQSKVRNVQLPKSLKVIGDCAFEHSAIESVDFPLGDGSFRVNPDVDTCRVTTVYERSFAHCYELREFKGARVNGHLKVCADNRILYQDTTVMAYAHGSGEAFLVIPDGLGIKRLGDHVFEMIRSDGTGLDVGSCSLHAIALPTGINDIGAHAFSYSRRLNAGGLYFHGTEPPAKGAEAFKILSEEGIAIRVYVPEGSKNTFQEALGSYVSVDSWKSWPPFYK